VPAAAPNGTECGCATRAREERDTTRFGHGCGLRSEESAQVVVHELVWPIVEREQQPIGPLVTAVLDARRSQDRTGWTRRHSGPPQKSGLAAEKHRMQRLSIRGKVTAWHRCPAPSAASSRCSRGPSTPLAFSGNCLLFRDCLAYRG
jgi:hypothetical protein